jgi:hypothetical protein
MYNKPVQMSSMHQSSGEFRSRQVSFWKKHATMLQTCADLSEKCGAKVLVRFSQR